MWPPSKHFGRLQGHSEGRSLPAGNWLSTSKICPYVLVLMKLSSLFAITLVESVPGDWNLYSYSFTHFQTQAPILSVPKQTPHVYILDSLGIQRMSSFQN